MRALSAQEVITAWEHGERQHLVDRALTMLSLSCPELSHAELHNLTVGQRNIRLLDVRRRTLGAMAQCFAHCPECQMALEFTVDTATLIRDEPQELTGRVSIAGYQIDYRLPTSRDLAVVVGYGDTHTSRLLLIERCILHIERDLQEQEVVKLPEAVIETLGAALIEHDPQAEIEFRLTCPACDARWATLFDIVSFFWVELEAEARRLLREVHCLATAYGWHEAEILALSSRRRQFYLEVAR